MQGVGSHWGMTIVCAGGWISLGNTNMCAGYWISLGKNHCVCREMGSHWKRQICLLGVESRRGKTKLYILYNYIYILYIHITLYKIRLKVSFINQKTIIIRTIASP